MALMAVCTLHNRGGNREDGLQIEREIAFIASGLISFTCTLIWQSLESDISILQPIEGNI